jgi:hypothetical protein
MLGEDKRVSIPPEMYTKKMQLMTAVLDTLRGAPFISPHLDNVDIDLYDGMKLFDFVDPGVLDDIPLKQTPAARIEIGEENIEELMWPCVDKTFRLYVHFKVIPQLGVDRAPLIDYYFGRITETLVTPDHFAGIALDISEVGNSPQAQGQNDPEPGGSIWFSVQYRHGFGNYFSETGNG